MKTNMLLGGGSSGSSPVVFQSALWANRAAYQSDGNTVRFLDVGGNAGSGGGTFMYWNAGTSKWKVANGQALLDAVDTANSGVANTTEQNLNPNAILIPAGLLNVSDRLYTRVKASKNGAADTATLNVRLGSTKTAVDALVAALTMTTAQRSTGVQQDFKIMSNTSIGRQGANNNDSMGGPSNSAYPSAVNLIGADTFSGSGLYFTIWQVMTGGTEFATLNDYTLTFESTDS